MRTASKGYVTLTMLHIVGSQLRCDEGLWLSRIVLKEAVFSTKILVPESTENFCIVKVGRSEIVCLGAENDLSDIKCGDLHIINEI